MRRAFLGLFVQLRPSMALHTWAGQGFERAGKQDKLVIAGRPAAGMIRVYSMLLPFIHLASGIRGFQDEGVYGGWPTQSG